MYQPNEYEMDPRSLSGRSMISDGSTLSTSMPATEKVQIQVRDQADESLENIEKTLKRGLEARQVGVRLTDCGK